MTDMAIASHEKRVLSDHSLKANSYPLVYNGLPPHSAATANTIRHYINQGVTHHKASRGSDCCLNPSISHWADAQSRAGL